MTPLELKSKLESLLPNASVDVVDLTGTADHYSVTVHSDAFEGLLPIKRHRMVHDILKSELLSGEIHALQLHTYAPSEH